MPRLNLQSVPAGVMITVGIALVPVIAWFDYYTGPYVSFSIFYLPPLALVAWYGGKWFGIMAAFEGAAAWFAADYFGPLSLSFPLHLWNAFVRFTVFLITALFVRSMQLQVKGLQKNLNEKTKEVETFHRLLPICSHCNKVSDELGNWYEMEVYVREHTAMEFVHSICPECAANHHGEQLKSKPE
jgi:K+-sensing histidine kinase KdpD